MGRTFLLGLLGLVGLGWTAAGGVAATKVTVSETHLCCGQCLKGVEAALKEVKGVSHTSSQEAKTIEITAESDAAAQTAIDALAKAGFYGKVDNASVKYAVAAVPTGAAEKVEVSGVHNCCGACATAIKKAVGSVNGVTGNTVKNKEGSFTVTGKFQPGELRDALLKAGFYAEVK
jgi:periplasmic mercuric ion binding protein